MADADPQVDAAGRISIIYRVLNALHRRGYLLTIDDNQVEFLANIALFVPIGMFKLLLFGTRLWWVALTASFGITTFIEIAQRSIPGRVPDEQDLVANGLGAVIGVLVAALVLTLPAPLRRGRQRQTITTAAARVPAG